MKRQDGFTLIELMVVIALVGILALTALPVYHTYQQRAYGSQAVIMARHLEKGQIAHILEHGKYFPTDSSNVIFIPPDTPPSSATQQALQEVQDHLNISIPLGQRLTYQIYSIGSEADECFIRISAPFVLFKNKKKELNCSISKDGDVIYF